MAFYRAWRGRLKVVCVSEPVICTQLIKCVKKALSSFPVLSKSVIHLASQPTSSQVGIKAKCAFFSPQS